MRVDFFDLPGQTAPLGVDNVLSVGCRTRVTIQPPDANPGLFQLTDGQRECLRLVYNHMTSKDIARRLDVSPHTVDMRLRTAMRTLGVANRVEAARLLMMDESGGAATPAGYQPLIYQSSDVAAPGIPPKMASPGSNEGTAGGAAELQPLRQPLNRNNLVVDPPVNGPPRLAVASVLDEAMLLTNGAGVGSFDPGVGTRSFVGSVPWGRRNDLAIGARMGWILIIAIGSALGFGAILAALAALKTLL